jgi:hypothetical protein
MHGCKKTSSLVLTRSLRHLHDHMSCLRSTDSNEWCKAMTDSIFSGRDVRRMPGEEKVTNAQNERE